MYKRQGLQDAAPDLPAGLYAEGAAAYDMMYGAQPTAFMRQAGADGAALTADGLGMLVGQAAESLSLIHISYPGCRAMTGRRQTPNPKMGAKQALAPVDTNSKRRQDMLAKSRLAAACAAAFAIAAGSAYAQQVPAGYPADYQKILDGAKKEGKVGIYSTTDTKAAGPIIKGFEALYPGVKVEYNDMNSTELYNRYISEQAAGGSSGDIVWSSSMDSALKLATDYRCV